MSGPRSGQERHVARKLFYNRPTTPLELPGTPDREWERERREHRHIQYCAAEEKHSFSCLLTLSNCNHFDTLWPTRYQHSATWNHQIISFFLFYHIRWTDLKNEKWPTYLTGICGLLLSGHSWHNQAPSRQTITYSSCRFSARNTLSQ